MVLASKVFFSLISWKNIQNIPEIQSQSPVEYVSAESETVSAMAFSSKRLAIASGSTCKVLDCRTADYALADQLDCSEMKFESMRGKLERYCKF